MADHQLWEVVGGVDKGGILVRSGRELSSPEESSRLSTGALIRQEELVGERLKYTRLSGTGPSTGWVSLKVKDKPMVVKSDQPDPTAPPEPEKPVKPVPNGGLEEPDDQASTEGGSPVKTEADQRTANDAPLGDVSFDDDEEAGEAEPAQPEPQVDAPKDTPPEPAAPSTPGEIVVGCQVEIQGLKSKPELNGKRATAMSKDESAGRWEVKLDGPADERVRCKPENLQVVVAKTSPKKAQGDANFKEGRLEQAIGCYREALEDAKGDAEFAATIQSNLAAAYAKKGDHDKALAAAEEAIRLRPDWAKAHSRKGLSLLSLGRFADAQASYIQAVKNDPVTDGYLAGLSQATEKLLQGKSSSDRQSEAELKKSKGNEALKAGQLPLAIACYTMAISAIKPFAESAQNLKQTAAVYSSNRSAAFAKLRQWHYSLGDAQESARLSPQWYKSQLRIATAYLGQGHAEHAYKTYLFASDLPQGYAEAMKECQHALWQIPRLESPLAKQRLTRFDQDKKRPKGWCRIFAISDVHIDHGGAVLKWAEGINDKEFKNDILIVAGDLGDTFNAIKRGLMIFKKKFRRVFYVPGNHDMWIRPNTDDSTKRKFKDSIDKLLVMLEMCDKIGAEMMPAEVMADVYVVPLLSWWSCTFCEGDPRPDDVRYDSFCKWPMGEEGAHKYFLMWNDYFVQRIQKQQAARGRKGDVITFSHFLPTSDLPCGGAPVKASGCLQLEEQIQAIGAPLHIFGHTHMNISYATRGVRYQQLSLMGPEYGLCERQTFLKVHDGSLCTEPRPHNVY